MDLKAPQNLISCSGSFSPEINLFQRDFTICKSAPSQPTPEQGNYTQQVVWLLTEQIQRRISWEHQKVLFSSQKQQERYEEMDENYIYAEDGIQKDQIYLEEKTIQKQYNLHQIKTPDLVPESRSNGCDNFFLENRIFQDDVIKKQWHCSCKKSKCIKMYCQCFRNGETCQGCDCCDCENTERTKETRKKAVQKIEKKQPTAFIDIFKYKGCRCSKSNCQKGYCQCFANGLMCGKYCKCRQCSNCTDYRKSKLAKTNQKMKVKI